MTSRETIEKQYVTSPKKKKARIVLLATQLMGSCFTKGCILIDSLTRRKTVGAAHYIQILQKLWHSLCNQHSTKCLCIKRYSSYSSSWQCTSFHCMAQDRGNCTMCTAEQLSPILQTVQTWLPLRLPPFGALKNYMKLYRYENGTTVQWAVCLWLQNAEMDFTCSYVFQSHTVLARMCWSQWWFCGKVTEHLVLLMKISVLYIDLCFKIL